MKHLILASGSSARKEILGRTGFPFIVDASKYEEDMSLNLEPTELAKHLSRGKAREVASRHKNAVILAADSFAVFNGELMGKPHTTEKARQMLATLSGQRHSFITGFTILDTDTGKEHSDAAETKVYFRELSGEEIDGYLAKENVLNNAGAYIIQSLGAVLVERIEGDYSNFMGLPLPKVAKALKEFDVNFL